MKNKGFTLIEISIVLLIIGVITGGIIIGQSLLVSSRLQTIITDMDSYATAVSNFKDTYQSLPGDFADATTRWGTDSNTCPTGGGATGTCNGNGNGMIANTNAASQANESFLFWQHLNKAGMFGKSLNNKASSGGANHAVIDNNTPVSSIKQAGFSATWIGTLSSDSQRYDGFYGNVFHFGANSSSNMTYGAALTPIDAKIDDQMPASGKVRAYKSNSTINPGCTTTEVSSTASYATTSDNRLCSLIFVPGF
jgi:prepilin-type N-terminal cleavage/methylation domain-containing protein